MGAAIDKITARLAAGEDVSGADLAAARAEDELTEMQASADAARAKKVVEAERLEAIDRVIEVFAAEVDAASEVVADAFMSATAAISVLEQARSDLESVASRHCHTLAHELQCPIRYDEVIEKTGGRVVYQPVGDVDSGQKTRLVVGPHWLLWYARAVAERSERLGTPLSDVAAKLVRRPLSEQSS